jgi:[ribosomal protein S18]-alanine N-acetyltransferase
VTVALRPAAEQDVGAIMAIERASFPTDAWSEAAMRSTLLDVDAVAELAEVGERIAGYGALLAPIGAPDADVLTIAVDEGHRGRGVGRALLTHLLDAAARRGARRVFLEVRADNPVARALYASEGFEAVGRRPRYYQPDDVDAIVMLLDLRRRGGAG